MLCLVKFLKGEAQMKVFRYLSNKLRIYCITSTVVALVGACVASIWPVLLSDIYDDISNGVISNINEGVIPFIIFGGVFVTSEIIAIFRRVWIDRISASFEKDLRNKSIEKLLHLPTKFFNNNISSEYTAKINQSVAGASQFIKVICNNIVPAVFSSTFTVIQVIRKAPVLIALILLSYIAFEMFVSAFQIKSQNGIRESLIASKAYLDGSICQTIQGIETVRVTNSEDWESNSKAFLTENIRRVESKHHIYMGSFDSIKKIIKVVYTVILLAVSVYLVSMGDISKGTVITIILLFQQLVVPIDTVHVFMDELASSSVKSKEITSLFASSEDDVFSYEDSEDTFPCGDINITNLTVYSPDRKSIICSDVNFTLKEGTVTALRGPTGCGKSSVIKGIMRFYPSEGDVAVGTNSIRCISQKRLCNGIYDMVQQPIFFAGTLKENLVYGLNNIPSDRQLIIALKNALIFDELTEKSNDILSITVSENGSNFSGGQRQRIALARAFLRQPKWFFVDEATANIDDNTTEKAFDNLIKYAKSVDAGILCISHQEKVVNKCDHIVNLTAKQAV